MYISWAGKYYAIREISINFSRFIAKHLDFERFSGAKKGRKIHFHVSPVILFIQIVSQYHFGIKIICKKLNEKRIYYLELGFKMPLSISV